ncbi:MAG TPA: hypothetical protein PKZ07_14555 [Sedimentisphaerales bacterium]|nr:hypothetical protein [Sedimentisphaerales bacterium]
MIAHSLQLPPETDLADIAYPHLIWISDNPESKETEFPDEVKKLIRSWKLALGNYRKAPSQDYHERLTRDSIRIADLLQDWSEQDLPPDPNTQTPPQQQSQTPPPAVTDQKELAVLEIINRDGRIHRDQLRAILGHLPSGRISVGATVLDQSWLVWYKPIR